MASDLIVPVVEIHNVRPHANADSLELCDVLGYQACIPKGVYHDGDKMVYFPADTLIPAVWADKWNVRNYLKGKDKDRVGRVRLRGEPSFGLLMSLPGETGTHYELGDNMADYYGCKKYEPPIRVSCGDAAVYDPEIDPLFEKFTDVQNGRMFPDVFKPGEEVIYTEKIHGTNCRVGLVLGTWVAGSMEVRRKRPVMVIGEGPEGQFVNAEWGDSVMKTNTYWFPYTLDGVRHLVDGFLNGRGTVILYGEIYGGSIQSLNYGIQKGKGLGFRAFGLKVEGKFLDWDAFFTVCSQYGVETVPVLARGGFTMERAKELADGKSQLADHMREGVVVYPVNERTDPRIGRVVLKFVGTEYALSKHQDMDTKDV